MHIIRELLYLRKKREAHRNNGIEDFPSIYKRTFSQMKLSVITINYNNAEGLAKTMDSVSDSAFLTLNILS